MSKNKVKLTICGADYNILSDDNEQYIIEVGNQVDKRMTEVLECNSRLSTTMAAILVALDFCDAAKKHERTIEAMKNRESKQLAQNLVNGNELSEAQLQIERLQKEVKQLKDEILSISKENANMVQCLSDQELEIQSLVQEKDNTFSDGDNDINDDEEILNFFDFQRIAEGI